MTYEHQAWPCWCDGPDGERRVFGCEDDVPVGWTHHGVTVGGHGGPSAPVEDLKALREAYRAKFGKRAFMGWSAEELKGRLA